MDCAGSICFRVFFFFFNDTATTEIYTLSLHDALPILAQFLTISERDSRQRVQDILQLPYCQLPDLEVRADVRAERFVDRKSTRLNSSHANISYAVFCLKKKNTSTTHYSSIT